MKPCSWCLLALLLFSAGCSESSPPAVSDEQEKEETAAPESESSASVQAPESAEQVVDTESEEPESEFEPITFGSPSSENSSRSMTSAKGSSSEKSNTDRADLIIKTLKDLQVLLGDWRGITNRNFNGSKSVDQTEWVWDFQTEPKQPALTMESEKSQYYRKARLTYLPEQEQYELRLADVDGNESRFLGTFTEEIVDEQGEDGKLQRSYKLQLTEQDTDDKPRRFVINQQNNNRYLLEVYEQRGGSDQFFRVDTVSTQREGTSMALIDEGYGEKTCIISGGLGTITVSHQGKTYYVCCTGCKAAFEEDPEKWIAKAENPEK